MSACKCHGAAILRLVAEQAVLEMPRKTNVSPALNSLSWPAFEDISTASWLSNEAVFKKKKKKEHRETYTKMKEERTQ